MLYCLPASSAYDSDVTLVYLLHPIEYQVMLYCLPASSAYDSDVALMYLLQLLQFASVEPVDEVLPLAASSRLIR